MNKQFTILAVDDDSSSLSTVKFLLKSRYKVALANSGRLALSYLEKVKPDLILLDMEMLMANGREVLSKIKSDKSLADVPVIFITPNDDRLNAEALSQGASDYISKPFNAELVFARVKTQLELAESRKQLMNNVDEQMAKIVRMQETTLQMLADITEFRGSETGGHIERTTAYVSAMLDKLAENPPPGYDISDEYSQNIKKSAPLHDLGKVSIPDYLLQKAGALTEAESEIMKNHAENGANLIKRYMTDNDEYSFLNVAYSITLTHHEKWDGNGYPCGLSGKDIPISGRVMAIADVFDALVSPRPYRDALPFDRAVNILRAGRGTNFDPVLLDVFLSIKDEVFGILNSVK